MSMNDPIADLLTRMRNACLARHRTVDVPTSKMKDRILAVFQREGYISGYQAVEGAEHPTTRVYLRYHLHEPVIQHVQRMSTPGLRRYVKASAIGRIRGGMGIAIISTSQGVMTDREARRQSLGGEMLAVVW
jgi:small subunit ribosomal protein S8